MNIERALVWMSSNFPRNEPDAANGKSLALRPKNLIVNLH